jgi:hypothetical protein
MREWDLKEGIVSAAVHARCTRQPAQNARKNARFRSSQMARGPYIAGIASRSTSRKETGSKEYFISFDYQFIDVILIGSFEKTLNRIFSFFF